MKRLGLAPRVALAVTALVGGLALASVGVVWIRTNQLKGPELTRSVLRAKDLVEDAVRSRTARLDLINSLLANDAPFRAYLAEADSASVLDNLRDRTGLYDCDAFLVTDRNGVVLADTRAPGASGRDASNEPLVARALAGTAGHGVEGSQDALFLASSAPILQGGNELVGTIVTYDAIDGDLASELRGVTGGELVFFRLAPLQPSATSLSLSRSELGLLLRDPALPLVMPGEWQADDPRHVEIDGEEFVALAVPLDDAAGKPSAGFVALRSVDRELVAFRKIQTALIIVGLAAIPLAVGLSVLFAHRITRPLALLVRATERIKVGDYRTPVYIAQWAHANDELGQLAGAFESMTAQLREKEKMDAYLGSVIRGASGPESTPAERAESPTATLADGSSVGRRETPEHGLAPGEIVARRFEIEAPLGRGGMGAVYRAFDRKLGEIVALKILTAIPSDPAMRRHLTNEIKLARRITHRNVVRTHDLADLPDGIAISMEYVEGMSLDALLRRGMLPLTAGLWIGRQIADGLEAAHDGMIVHRDLKPTNFLIDTTGTVKIADFGLAYLADERDAGDRPARFAGTPGFMSPEQIRGETLDVRSDIYSVGVVLFHIFCGRPPFEAGSIAELLAKHVGEPPPDPRELRPELTERVASVILRALEKEPDRRFASAKELGEALAGVETEAAAS